MQIFVKLPSGRTITIDCEPCDTVLNIKNRVDDREAIKPEAQRLIYGGKQLVDENSLAQYGIQPEATLTLVFRLNGGFTVFVKTILARLHRVQTSGEETVELFSEKVSKEIGVEVERLRLLFGGQDLWREPASKLGAFGIGEGSVIHAIESMPSCSCINGCNRSVEEIHAIQ